MVHDIIMRHSCTHNQSVTNISSCHKCFKYFNKRKNFKIYAPEKN